MPVLLMAHEKAPQEDTCVIGVVKEGAAMRSSMTRRRRVQSTLEYVLVLAAVILGILVGTTRIKQATSKGLNDASDAMEKSTGKFKDMMN